VRNRFRLPTKAVASVGTLIPRDQLTYEYAASGGCGLDTRAGLNGNRTRTTDSKDGATPMVTVGALAPWAGLALAPVAPSPIAAAAIIFVFDLTGLVAGAAGTGIDCLANAASPACIVGLVGVLGGTFGTSLTSTARHLPQWASAGGKMATALGIQADAFTLVTSWGAWWSGA